MSGVGNERDQFSGRKAENGREENLLAANEGLAGLETTGRKNGRSQWWCAI